MSIDARAEADTMLQLMQKSWNLSSDTLQRVGALTLSWAAFENGLERFVWWLGGVDYKDVRPTTDLKHGEELLKMFEETCAPLGGEPWQDCVRRVCATARLMLIYRNAIAHGIPNQLGATISNASTHGERRKKPPSMAVLRVEVLDQALAVTATLLRFSVDALEAAQLLGPVEATVSASTTSHAVALAEAEQLAGRVLVVDA